MQPFRKQIVWSLGILVATGLITAALMGTAKRPKRAPSPPFSPAVEVMPLTPGTHAVFVEGYGNVQAAREVAVRPQVAGLVVEKNPAVRPGGQVKKKDLLFRIDERDHRLALKRKEAAVAKARAALEIEQGQQAIARAEWAALAKRLSKDKARQRLALREPQMREAEANLTQAESELAEAKLDLERTRLYAPFDAVVLSHTVEEGRLVTSGENAVTLLASDEFWVEVMLGANEVERLSNAAAQGGVTAEVSRPGSGEAPRSARLVSVLPDLAQGSRLGRALVAIDDPLLMKGNSGQPMRVGTYVHVRLAAGSVENMLAVPREAVRENNLLWVRDAEGRLAFREAHDLLPQGEKMLLRAGLQAGDQLIVSRLARAVPGTRLRVTGEKGGSDGGA